MSHISRRHRLPLPLLALSVGLFHAAASPAHALVRPKTPGSANTVAVAKGHSENAATRAPNEMGRVPIIEWHQIVGADGSYKVSRERFKAELTELHTRGYVPISLGEYLDKKIDLPAGKSPVLFTFDDASPSQFSYVERNGSLQIDPLVRNLGIIALVAAAITAIGHTSQRVLSALYTIASLALILGLLLLAYRVWKENRGTFSLMSTKLRLALYGSVRK